MIEQTFDTDGVACRLFFAFDDKIDTLLTVCCAFILILFSSDLPSIYYPFSVQRFKFLQWGLKCPGIREPHELLTFKCF